MGDKGEADIATSEFEKWLGEEASAAYWRKCFVAERLRHPDIHTTHRTFF